MTAVWLFLGLMFLILAGALGAVSAWGQRWFYENVVDGLVWRVPAAAGVLTVVLAGWAWLEAKVPGRFDSLFRYSASDVTNYEHFWSEKRDVGVTSETLFHRHTIPPGRIEYVDDSGKPWRRSDSGIVTAIIVEEGGDKKRFVAKLDPDGNFLRDPRDPNKTLEVEYREEGGKRRVMTENEIGSVSSTRVGGFIVNLIFNLLIAVIWIVVFALLLSFDWSRAVLLGLIGWLVVVLLAWPALQERVAAQPARTAVWAE